MNFIIELYNVKKMIPNPGANCRDCLWMRGTKIDRKQILDKMEEQKIKILLKNGTMIKTIAKMFNVSERTISRIKYNYTTSKKNKPIKYKCVKERFGNILFDFRNTKKSFEARAIWDEAQYCDLYRAMD